MWWVLLSLFSAVTQSGRDYCVKKLSEKHDLLMSSALQSSFVAITSFGFVLILGWPVLREGFWPAL